MVIKSRLTAAYSTVAFWASPSADKPLEVLEELIDFMMQQFLPGVTLNMLTRGLNLLTYPVYLKINLLSLLFLLILKIRNSLSFVISIISLFVVLFLTITN